MLGVLLGESDLRAVVGEVLGVIGERRGGRVVDGVNCELTRERRAE